LLLYDSLRRGRVADVATGYFFARNWLYLAWPQLLLGVMALIFMPSLLRLGVLTLVALDGLLVFMNWLLSDDRDAALGWVLYPALAILILGMAVASSLLSGRRSRGP
jgi:hypothetical protein